MNSLYQISEDILAIFNEIEANEGEVTEEQLEFLEIKQEELQEKLTSYKKAIRVWDADIEACKAEEKRIKTARQIKENRIDRLKDRMLQAVLTFGYDGKANKKGKTNKFYELTDGRLFTKTIESVEIEENRNAILINLLIEICKDDIEVFPYENEEFYEFILNKINEKLHLYYEGLEDFTIKDLQICVLNYTVEINIKDLITKYSDRIKEYNELTIPFLGLSNITPKPILKLALQLNENITIAKLKETESLTIK